MKRTEEPVKKKSRAQLYLFLGLVISLVVFVLSLANGRGLDTFIMAGISLIFAIALVAKIGEE